eukprot:703720-Prorocentrum_minimum.AAC.1
MLRGPLKLGWLLGVVGASMGGACELDCARSCTGPSLVDMPRGTCVGLLSPETSTTFSSVESLAAVRPPGELPLLLQLHLLRRPRLHRHQHRLALHRLGDVVIHSCEAPATVNSELLRGRRGGVERARASTVGDPLPQPQSVPRARVVWSGEDAEVGPQH